MQEMLIPRPRSRRFTIVSLLLTLQGLSFLAFAVLIAFLAVLAMRNAAIDHKPTAAALTTAFAIVGGGLCLLLGLLAFVLAWFLWKQQGWTILVIQIIEGLVLFLSLALLCGGSIWLLLSEGVLAAAILACLITNHRGYPVSSP